MNKKLLLIACAVCVSSAHISFGMEAEEPALSTTKHTETDWTRPTYSSGYSADADDKKRIDDPVHHDNNAKPLRKIKNKKPDFITENLSHLYTLVHASAPAPVKMLMDEATKTEYRVNATKTAAFIGTECCMFHCCPEMFKLVTYTALGSALILAYQDCTAKEKEL